MQRNLIYVITVSCAMLLSACATSGSARVEPLRSAGYFGGGDRLVSGKSEDKIADIKNCEVAAPTRGGRSAKARSEWKGDRPGMLNLDCLAFADRPEELAYLRAVRELEVKERLIYRLIDHSNAICTSEMGLIYKTQSEVNGWLSILTTGLSTASTIVTGDLAKSILSGGAALTSSSRDHVNTHAFFNQILPTISKAIDVDRDAKLEIIRKKLAASSEKVEVKDRRLYTVDEAISDVNEYHQMCSYTYGMQVVLDSVNGREEISKMRTTVNIDRQLMQLSQDLAEDRLTVEDFRERSLKLIDLRESEILGSDALVD